MLTFETTLLNSIDHLVHKVYAVYIHRLILLSYIAQ